MVVENGLVAVGMYFVARFGLRFAGFQDQVSAISPGAGLGLALLFWRGYRIWPGLFLAGLFSRYSTGQHNLAFALCYVASGTSITVCAAWLLRRLIGRRVDFGEINQVLRFLLWGAVVRGDEMDTLTWDQIDVERSLIRVETNVYTSAKSSESEAMPVVLTGPDMARWIGDSSLPEVAIQQLCQPIAGDRLVAREVNRYGNKPRAEGPKCLDPPDESEPELALGL